MSINFTSSCLYFVSRKNTLAQPFCHHSLFLLLPLFLSFLHLGDSVSSISLSSRSPPFEAIPPHVQEYLHSGSPIPHQFLYKTETFNYVPLFASCSSRILIPVHRVFDFSFTFIPSSLCLESFVQLITDFSTDFPGALALKFVETLRPLLNQQFLVLMLT